MHQIDPARLDLAREFKAKSLGPHGPDLQKLLKIMRWDPVAGRVVAVQPERDGPWYLARLTGPKGHPVELFRQRAYVTLQEGIVNLTSIRRLEAALDDMVRTTQRIGRTSPIAIP